MMISRVTYLTIDLNSINQRIDNYLFKQIKPIPKSRLYRALRSGEVRVNRKRVKPSYKLQLHDSLRIPAFSGLDEPVVHQPAASFLRVLSQAILYEDNRLMVINKPAEMVVHAGSGRAFGIIEGLRALYPEQFLELVHRLDKGTSGCLLVAKSREFLLQLHQALKERRIKKQYLALLSGPWFGKATRTVNQPLQKNCYAGEHKMVINQSGKPAKTQFTCLKRLKINQIECSLVQAMPVSGRTHQIRVHAASLGLPLVGDQKYGNKAVNQAMKKAGFKRLYLHANSIDLFGQRFESMLPDDWPASNSR